MSNISTELFKEKEKKETSYGDVVKQVKLLEAGDAAVDLHIANALGGQHSVARAQGELGKKLEIEKLEGKYAGNVFTIDQIKALAGKYNMRFLASRNYCGNLDLEVISKIKQFHKETGVSIDDGSLRSFFYILAPENCFKLNKMVRVKKDPDPAIFYKINETHYRLIHQWGTDFSIFNRIAGLNWKNRVSKFLVQLAFTALVAGAVVWGSNIFLTGKAAVVVPLLFGVLGLIRSLIMGFSDFHDNSDFHSEKWNSENKLEKR